MTLKIELPGFVNEKSNTEDMIISILSYNYPLSTQKLYNSIKKLYRYEKSYQALHKTLNRLQKEKIIIKEGKEYFLNIEWINNICDFGNNLKARYQTKKEIRAIHGNQEILVFRVTSLFELDKLLLNLEKEYSYKDDRENIIIMHFRHSWWPIIYGQGEYINDSETKKNKFYGLCRGNTKLDKYSKRFYEKLGVKIKICSSVADIVDTFVYGENIVQVFIDKKILDEIDKIFEKATIENFDVPKFVKNILNRKTSIQIIVNKNKDIADQIRERTFEEFD